MGQGVRLQPHPLFFLRLWATRKGRGRHIHFRHIGRAWRLTANTLDAPILWSLDERAIAKRSVFDATVRRLVFGATAKQSTRKTRVK